MKIDHIALYVRDLEGARRFFETYFGGNAGSMYHNPHTGLRTYFITLPDGGARIEVMSRAEVADEAPTPYRRGLAHLAVSVGSKAAVDSLTGLLAAGGYRVVSGPRTTGDGYYESCVIGFEGTLIEITE